MYLILYPKNNSLGQHKHVVFESVFTEDKYYVAQCLEEAGVKAYKLDSLTELTEIEVTFQEVTKETKNV